jgi:uncharacterized SAM-binding protein YcdF (DUF218 family)
LTVAFLLLAAAWLVAWTAARLLIVSIPLERADAIVVLSGSRNLTERAAKAAELFKTGKSSRIVITNDNLRGGWNPAEQRNPFFFESAKAELRGHGVPDANIIVIPQPVQSTRDEALRVRGFAEEHQLGSVLIVTSAYHSRRALLTFRQEFAGTGVTIGIMPATTGWQTPAPRTWWLHRSGWEMVAGEYVKLAYYRLRL